MSSKKARRKRIQKKQAKEAEKKRGMNPATLFMLLIAGALILLLGAAWLFGVGGEGPPGDPPWPGAVWSPAHGHWH